MMVKLLVHGYATGVFSSRKMERRPHENLALRMLGAGNFPRHRTIRDFRALHLSTLSDLFVQVVRLARELGLVKLGTVAIDGTKLQANASRYKAMSYERMQQSEGELKARIDALLERAKTTDEAEADEPELDIPAELERREVRLKAIQDARERLAKRQRDADADTDTDTDTERGRSQGDDRRPRDPNGQPTGGRYQREFGVPARKRCAQIDALTQPHTAAVAAKLQTSEGRSTFRRRKWLAGPPNGWINSVLGFRQFSLRGLRRVQAEFKLVCLALNLRRTGAVKAA